MIEIPLTHPFPNGSEGNKIHPDGQKFIDLFNEMGKLQEQGKCIYIKILTGDRKGSIAKFVTDTENYKNNKYLTVKCSYSGVDYSGLEYSTKKIHYNTEGTHGYFIWDGRRNKIQADLWATFEGSEKYAWLKDYNGPTIYRLFDKKKHIKKRLKSIPQKDINGEVLKIGDEVLYCNIRYGCGTVLCKGTIKDFKGKTRKDYSDKQRTSIYTIVLNEDGKTESKIENSHLMIKKWRN
jgi:hypothetical protein